MDKLKNYSIHHEDLSYGVCFNFSFKKTINKIMCKSKHSIEGLVCTTLMYYGVFMHALVCHVCALVS
jgi:hypothetical protein